MNLEFTPAFLTAWIPVILGGIFSYFKPYIGDRDKFKERCQKSLDTTSEKIAVEISELIRQTSKFDNLPRGDGIQTPDYCGNVASAINRHSKISIRADRWINTFGYCESTLVFCTIFALICMFISLIMPSWTNPLVIIVVVITFVEISAILATRSILKRSEQDAEIL